MDSNSMSIAGDSAMYGRKIRAAQLNAAVFDSMNIPLPGSSEDLQLTVGVGVESTSGQRNLWKAHAFTPAGRCIGETTKLGLNLVQ